MQRKRHKSWCGSNRNAGRHAKLGPHDTIVGIITPGHSGGPYSSAKTAYASALLILLVLSISAVVWRRLGNSVDDLASVPFIFIWHDPGARNYLRPIMAAAERDGIRVIRNDVRLSGDKNPKEGVLNAIRDAPRGAVFVFGLSMNHIERHGVVVANRLGAKTIMMVEPPGLLGRLDSLQLEEIPDAFLLGMRSMEHDLAALNHSAHLHGKSHYCGPTLWEACLLDARKRKRGAFTEARAELEQDYLQPQLSSQSRREMEGTKTRTRRKGTELESHIIKNELDRTSSTARNSAGYSAAGMHTRVVSLFLAPQEPVLKLTAADVAALLGATGDALVLACREGLKEEDLGSGTKDSATTGHR